MPRFENSPCKKIFHFSPCEISQFLLNSPWAGLKRGDPLAPLLFLLVVEGLGALLRRAVTLNKFQPFLVGREVVSVSLLQYAGNTICIGEVYVGNLWVFKAVLCGFQMASGIWGLMLLPSSWIWQQTFLIVELEEPRSNIFAYRSELTQRGSQHGNWCWRWLNRNLGHGGTSTRVSVAGLYWLMLS
jgi:hypothetical protein